jgi:hypothetical protein
LLNDIDDEKILTDVDDAPGGPLYSWNFIILFGVFADAVGVTDVADAIGVDAPGVDDVPGVTDVALRIPHGPTFLRDLPNGRSAAEEAMAAELVAAAAAEAFNGQLPIAVRAAEPGIAMSATVVLTPDESPTPAVAFGILMATPAETNDKNKIVR